MKRKSIFFFIAMYKYLSLIFFISLSFARESIVNVFEEKEKKGVSIKPIVWFDNQWGISGGKNRGYNYASNVELDLKFNLEKICNLPNSKIFISGFWNSGKNLAEKIGAFYPTSFLYAGQNVLIDEVSFSKGFDNGFFFKLGRLNTAVDFLSIPQLDYFLSVSMNGSPGSVFYNYTVSTTPFATTGAYFSQTIDPFVFQLGVYSANHKIYENKYHGLSFSLGDGIFFITQGQFNYSIQKYPGSLYLGGLYYTKDAPHYLGGKGPGNYGVYLLWNQKAWMNSIGGGLSVFFTSVLAPENRNLFPFYYCVGCALEKFMKTRPQDFIAFGYSYSHFSSDLNQAKKQGRQNIPFATYPNQDFEGVLELGYGLYFHNQYLIQPDVQYIIHPDGLSHRQNAVVVGINFVASF